MAENETLDLADGRNRHWAGLAALIRSGASADDAAAMADECLRKTFRRLLAKNPVTGAPQIPFAELLDAVCRDDRRNVRDLVHGCEGHQFAQMLGECLPNKDPEVVTTEFVAKVLDRFIDQVDVAQCGERRFPTCSSLFGFRSELQQAVAPQVSRLSAQLATTPGRPPRAPSRPKHEHQARRRGMLSESLLSRSR